MGENISDINGGNNDYATLALWEAGVGGDITAGNAEVAEVYGSYSVADTVVSISGWTTDADSYWGIRVPTNLRRSDSDPLRFGQGVNVQVNSDYKNGITINAGAEYGLIEGLEMAINGTNVNPLIDIRMGTPSAGDITIEDCVLTFNGTGSDRGIYNFTDGTASITVINTVVYNADYGIYLDYYGTSVTMAVYNCTVYNCDSSNIYGKRNTITCYNVLSYASSGTDFSGSLAGDYNFSKDDSAPGANSIHGDTDSKTPDFISTTGGSEDFQLQSTSDAIGTGTDDPGSGLYSDDINRDARSSTWDIGADEYVSGGGGLSIPVAMRYYRNLRT